MPEEGPAGGWGAWRRKWRAWLREWRTWRWERRTWLREWRTWRWDVIDAVGTCAAGAAAVIAVLVAWYQLSDVASARRAQNYLELRKEFLQIDKDLDIVVRDTTTTYPNETTCPARNALRRYWYFVQTEWTIASIDTSERENWEKTQLPLALVALSYAAFRKAFVDMKGNALTTDQGKKFFAEVSAAFLKLHDKSIEEYEKPHAPVPCPASGPVKSP